MSKETGLWEKVKPFFIGSCSGMIATTVIQPIDTIKVLIQLKKQDAGQGKIDSPLAIAREQVSSKGFLSLYSGLDAALLRQIVYTGIRLGLYKTIEDSLKEKRGTNLTFLEKTGYSMLTGLIGSFIANPVDLSLVRMQADNNLPPEKRRNYTNAFNAVFRITKEEGVTTLWRGSVPTMARAMAVNSSQLVTYNTSKESIMSMLGAKDETATVRLMSSAASGVAVALCALPFDNVKTKVMSMKANEKGELPYKGFVDCFVKSASKEGVTALWVGLPTFYLRVGPHAMITVLAQDLLHDLFKRKAEKQ